MNHLITYPIPAQAAQVLRRVQQEVPEAIVAGGCLRDAIMNRPINDIDVFVPEDQAARAAMAIYETHPKHVKTLHEAYFTFNNDVRRVSYYEGGEGKLPVNIIGVYQCTPEKQMERFDFGICRVAFDGIRLWKDLAFDRDQRDETFSLLVDQTEEQLKYSLQRFERLQGKYNGWRFVNRAPVKTSPFDL